MTALAAKLLSAVEVSSDASHQHEFHAGMLRKVLELPEALSGQLDIVYLDDAGNIDQEACAFTLYDARAGRPRSAEYRLYFSSRQLQANAREGDILVIIRGTEAPDLRALVIGHQSDVGRVIASILADTEDELTQKFKNVSRVLEFADVAGLISATAEPSIVVPPQDMLSLADSDFISAVLSRGVLPDTRSMAVEAGRMIERYLRGAPDPDDFLTWSLEAETALFNHLEDKLAQRELDALQQRGAITFADATSIVVRRLQARKSRRGQSLQHHFRALLTIQGIRHGEQCSTEYGERPDFIVPGCEHYLNRDYPAARLRMIACKSTLKDRWGQVLKEAERVPEKYLLTLDQQITADLASRVLAQRVLLFLPRQIIVAAYDNTETASRLRNVKQLIELLIAA